MKKSKIKNKEVWKKIRNYPYAVSNLGRVKRIKSASGTYAGKILKSTENTSGYLHVCLYENRIMKDFPIHRLVAEAFIGPCPKDKEVNHKDGDKLNNHANNLEYVTKSENHRHAFRLGLKNHKGEKHPESKLKGKEILKIRKLYKTGEYFQREIAEIFNISQANISYIVNRKNWNHL